MSVQINMNDKCSVRPADACRWLPAGLAALVTGCSGGLMTGDGFGSGGLFAPKGEPWTIQCLVLRGPNRGRNADAVAEVLGSTPGIRGSRVRVSAGDDATTIYYGRYVRPIDAETRRLVVTDAMDRDMRLIKALGVPGRGHYFADAKFVPIPTPDVGDPNWSLDHARGVYTLRVAVFANEPDFYQRKKAAAEYVAALRRKGYPAFYRHGDIHSEVFVGEFGEDAVRPLATQGPVGGRGVVAFDLPGPEVRAVQAKETFAFELWNLRKRGERIGDKTVYTASQVIRIREEAESDAW